MILSLVNNKGGVAKTTTAVNLAAGLAGKKSRVLLIDLDNQSSASFFLGVERADLSPSMADVIFDGFRVRDAIRKTDIVGLDLLTGAKGLAETDLRLANIRGREYQVKDAIEPLRDGYDFIILDCPPSLSLLSINALIASDAFIIPVQPQYLALEGLVDLMTTVKRIQQEMEVKASLLGILLTLVDYRTRSTLEVIDVIRGHFREKVFQTEIRVNIRLAEAPSFGKTIFEYDPTSTGANAYQRLTVEVLNRCRKTGKP